MDVYEARKAHGGKARSQALAGTGRGGRRDLPGEHGFRFFPAFYRHVIDTMQRIPYGADGGRVSDNLRASTEAGVAFANDEPVLRFLRRAPSSPRELIDGMETAFSRMGVSYADALLYTERVLRYYTSCPERRLDVYEKMSWWDYLGADRYAPMFQRYQAAIPRIMVAMDARLGSARTIGDISAQLIVDFSSSGTDKDRVLNGPTTDKWLAPWASYLARRGVRFHLDRPVRSIRTEGRTVVEVDIEGEPDLVRADYYLLAVPIEAVRPLVSDAMANTDPSLGRLKHLPQRRFDRLTNWMNGLQFYLRRDVPIVAGHTFYPDAPWAMTSISQPQFWREDGAFEERFGDGSAKGLISIDLSDWFSPGTYVNKPASECTPDEVAAEVWQQLKAGLNARGDVVLRDDDRVGYHLDDDLERASGGGGFANRSRLLVHPPGSWQYRPEATTAFENLTLAGDYVRTHTDLATMEGANESARRAVNGIIEHSGLLHSPCDVWPLREPALFAPAVRLDQRLDQSGWSGKRHAFDLWPGSVQTVAGLARTVELLLQGRPEMGMEEPRMAA